MHSGDSQNEIDDVDYGATGDDTTVKKVRRMSRRSRKSLRRQLKSTSRDQSPSVAEDWHPAHSDEDADGRHDSRGYAREPRPNDDLDYQEQYNRPRHYRDHTHDDNEHRQTHESGGVRARSMNQNTKGHQDPRRRSRPPAGGGRDYVNRDGCSPDDGQYGYHHDAKPPHRRTYGTPGFNAEMSDLSRPPQHNPPANDSPQFSTQVQRRRSSSSATRLSRGQRHRLVATENARRKKDRLRHLSPGSGAESERGTEPQQYQKKERGGGSRPWERLRDPNSTGVFRADQGGWMRGWNAQGRARGEGSKRFRVPSMRRRIGPGGAPGASGPGSWAKRHWGFAGVGGATSAPALALLFAVAIVSLIAGNAMLVEVASALGMTTGMPLFGASQVKPNVVLFFPDDMGYNDVGYTNSGISKSYKTPNIDSLAKSGVRLTNYYSSYVCTPSRCSLMTGRYPARYDCQGGDAGGDDGWALSLSETTVAEQLSNAGYYNMMVGKWHLGYPSYSHTPTGRGFDKFVGFLGGGNDHYSHASGDDDGGDGDGDGDYDWWEDNSINYNAKGTHGLVYINNTIDTFIRSYGRKRAPFFIYAPTLVPHNPMEATNTFLAQVSNNLEGDSQTWAAMMLMLDSVVGNTVTALKDVGLYKTSIIIYAGCHGANDESAAGGSYSHSYPFQGGKGSVMEGAVRVPAFVHSPLLYRKLQGSEYAGVTSVFDWFPTLSAVAGTKTTPLSGKAVDGVDLSKLLFRGRGLSSDRAVLISIETDCNDKKQNRKNGDDGTSMRMGRYKIVTGCVSSSGSSSFSSGDMAIYDVTSSGDPTESTDLYQSSSWVNQNGKTISKMKKVLTYLSASIASDMSSYSEFCANGCADNNCGDRGYVSPWLNSDGSSLC